LWGNICIDEYYVRLQAQSVEEDGQREETDGGGRWSWRIMMMMIPAEVVLVMMI
jgi:hypothetical protein